MGILDKIAEEDIQWLAQHYPDLNFNKNTNEIIGELFFDMAFDPVTKYHRVYYDVNYGENSELRIRDTYEVKIVFNPHSPLPEVFEIGQRIANKASKLSLPNEDVHLFPDNKCCLLSPADYQKAFDEVASLKDFILKLFIPYFYAQTYHSKYQKWPWGERSHGLVGILENFFELDANYKNDIIVLRYLASNMGHLTVYAFGKRIGPDRNKIICPCTRKGKMKTCHRKAFLGLMVLRGNIDQVIKRSTKAQIHQ
jgi:hypothetical protein